MKYVPHHIDMTFINPFPVPNFFYIGGWGIVNTIFNHIGDLVIHQRFAFIVAFSRVPCPCSRFPVFPVSFPRVVVAFSDTGNGIPDAEKARIFDKFYCGESKIADNRRSLGLGLYLCKAIVEAHGGVLLVEDNMPHGCVFSFTLPLGEVTLHE